MKNKLCSDNFESFQIVSLESSCLCQIPDFIQFSIRFFLFSLKKNHLKVFFSIDKHWILYLNMIQFAFYMRAEKFLLIVFFLHFSLLSIRTMEIKPLPFN